DALIRRKSSGTDVALAAPADRRRVVEVAGVDDARVAVAAGRASHRVFGPPPPLPVVVYEDHTTTCAPETAELPPSGSSAAPEVPCRPRRGRRSRACRRTRRSAHRRRG